MHIADLSNGNLGANGIVAGSLTISVGAALSLKIQKQDTFEEKKYKFDNTFKRDDILLETKYPYNTFKLTAARNSPIIKIAFFIIYSDLWLIVVI